ncbi:nicotinate phosphoribosyltransferase [Lactobacillus hominis]|uniref:Nicotinate phosphoribosyltransferase n=1 Tax=Lactobacillus hominis DSM 23910 = CRBIP 24.179 TaxID=1423758 RepID=I7LAC1_9LACO|nr:nicotinate phosphoribosyltransferase [Lactobacillus hominis]KRM84829.1 nicotinate phosphoribosyltransferase [Lactobacillus hominis DSM 23910 = CRBIP 24.179]MCT3347866.1 nicotinate phosphoribosyltransferase [Lactobacillus hominis]CCI82129.1 Nicotinate phosphoribosyltransferase [Lactobacillus hominis DSM 23910 = CRBIP 24.179]
MLNTNIDQDDSLILHTDLYEINMMYTYFKKGISERNAVFEVFFRKEPFGNGYALNAGLSHVIEYLNNFHFSESDLQYLKEQENYDDDFIDYLRNMKLQLTVRSALEGELVFAHEPIMQIEGPLAQCQLVETAILNIINFQTLIATKAARIKVAVGDDGLMEFGTRRAQETDAAIWGTRAAYIGGFDATSNVRAGKLFGIPISGTHAHSLVESFDSEYEAFKAYAETHKDCVFLVDTYDTLRSGVPTAIKVAKEMGDKINFLGVRIDSGDMAYISKKVRKQLDDAGFRDAKIFASNDLDEKTIQNLKMQDAKIDVWGIGTKLITAFDQPALGGVYKLVAIEDENGNMRDTLKISSNAEKVSTPGKKQVWRIQANSEKKNEGDWVSEYDEDPRDFEALFMFHPQYTYINKVVTDFTARPLLQTIFLEGEQVYHEPSLQEVKEFAAKNLDGLWDEYKRSLNPQDYPVDLSQRLYDHKMNLINDIRSKIMKRGY